eukprot:1159431-Pelagomonas_calceolata.AAC.8
MQNTHGHHSLWSHGGSPGEPSSNSCHTTQSCVQRPPHSQVPPAQTRAYARRCLPNAGWRGYCYCVCYDVKRVVSLPLVSLSRGGPELAKRSLHASQPGVHVRGISRHSSPKDDERGGCANRGCPPSMPPASGSPPVAMTNTEQSFQNPVTMLDRYFRSTDNLPRYVTTKMAHI